MKLKTNSHGYIMIFTLLIIGAAMIVVTYIGHRGSFYMPFSHMVIAREKAKMLALGGVQIAIAQLAQPDSKDDKNKEASTKQTSNQLEQAEGADPAKKTGESIVAKQSPEKEFLKRILPVLNRWQEFDLKQETDGIDARISICLMSEEGKINLNQIIDFKKNSLKGTDQRGWKVILQEIAKAIQRIIGGEDLFPAFEKIAKEVKFELNDATELITRKEFNHFKDILFYQPPMVKGKETIYLTDIFTVWSSSEKIEPWLFSDSMNALLGLPRVEGDDIKKRKESVENWLKSFKVRSNWQKDWDAIFKPIYGKELRSLPKNIDSMLSTNFSPRFFSLRVHAKVSEVTQMVYAIVERIKNKQGSGEYDIEIKKLYWL